MTDYMQQVYSIKNYNCTVQYRSTYSPQLANLHTKLSFLTSESKRSFRFAVSISLSHFSSAFSRLVIVLRMLRTCRYGHRGIPYCRHARFSLFREMPKARAAASRLFFTRRNIHTHTHEEKTRGRNINRERSRVWGEGVGGVGSGVR